MRYTSTVSLMLVLSVLGVGRCKHLLGSNPCTWGPTWWCINETTANGCGTIKHCVEKVWKSGTPPFNPQTNKLEKTREENAMTAFLQNPVGLLPVEVPPAGPRRLGQDACDSCKDRVLEIQVLIKNNETSEGFEKILTQDCVKWFHDEKACYQLITQSSEEIFSLMGRSSPEQVCELVLQCGSLCRECKGEMAMVEKALGQNATDEEVVEISLQFCARLGPYSEDCKATVSARMGVVIDDLVAFLEDDPCAQLGVCNAEAQALKASGSDLECSFCIFVWEYVVHSLDQNQTEQEIEDLLKKMCSLFGSKIERICDNLVVGNFHFFIEEILKYATPHEFCTKIKVCNTSQSVALATLPRQTPSALLCSALASIAQSVFASELVVRSVVQVFYMVCNLLPDETSIEKCQSFVMLYVAGILQLINAALPFSYLCVALLGEKPQLASSLYQDSPTLRGMVECSLCEIVLDVVRMDIDTNKSVREIQNDVNMTCQSLPEGSLREDCESAVRLVPILLDLLSHDINPEEICYYLDSCPNSTDTPGHTAVVSREAYQAIDLQCFACKAGIQFLFTFLSSNHTLEDIIVAVNQLCYLVSPNYGCRAYLEELLPPILRYLEQQLSPEQVCLSVGMCQEDGSERDEGAPNQQVEDVSCFLWSALATLLDKYADSRDEEAVVQVASRMCDQMGLLADQCKHLAENALPAVVEKLRDGESPQQLCQTLKLCQASTRRVSISLIESGNGGESDCESCEEAIASIEKMLSTDGEDSTRDYLMEQCVAAYPVFVCKQAVSELISLVKSGQDASIICSNLNLCHSNFGTNNLKYIDCDTCEKYGKMVEDKISEDMSSNDFEEVLLDICSQEQISNCQVYVKMYYKMLYRLAVKDKQNYQEICQELSFCSANDLKAKYVSVGKNKKMCSECKFIIKLAKKILSHNDEQTIEEKLDYVCNLLGEDQYEKCKELLDSFIDKAIDLINGNMSVSELCEAMEACSTQLETLQSTHMKLWEKLQHSPSADCTLCTWISGAVAPSLLERYSHVAAREQLLRRCGLLPAHEQPRCRQFLANEYFISALRSRPYSHVCQTINVCKAAPAGVSLAF